MGQVGEKMRRIGSAQGYTAGGFAHWCPACEEMHAFATDGPNSMGAQWTWNHSVERPSFSPSMNIRTYGGEPGAEVKEVCHYFLKDGQIQYLGDCTHALAGQTVPLPDLPNHLTD